MATLDVPQELFSTLLFGDNDEFQSFLADDLAAFRASHRSITLSSQYFPYLFLMGDEDDALIIAEEASSEDASIPQPMKVEFVEKLEDVRVEKSGLLCSICLDEMLIGSRAKGLPCSHMYHESCIGEWLKKTNTCPVCRHPMRLHD